MVALYDDMLAVMKLVNTGLSVGVLLVLLLLCISRGLMLDGSRLGIMKTNVIL